jgi:hypothetical protein
MVKNKLSPVFMERVFSVHFQHFLFTKLTYNYCIPFHQLENEMEIKKSKEINDGKAKFRP